MGSAPGVLPLILLACLVIYLLWERRHEHARQRDAAASRHPVRRKAARKPQRTLRSDLALLGHWLRPRNPALAAAAGRHPSRVRGQAAPLDAASLSDEEWNARRELGMALSHPEHLVAGNDLSALERRLWPHNEYVHVIEQHIREQG